MRAVTAALATLLALGPAWRGAALAAEPDAASEASRAIPRMTLVLVGSAPPPALGEQVTSWFRSATTDVRAASTLDAAEVLAVPPAPGVRVWIVMRGASTARLAFSVQRERGDAPRFLVHDVDLPGGLDEVGREHLAQIVYLSALALWEGTEETARSEVVARLGGATETPRARASVASTEPRWQLGVEYALRGRGDEGVGHGPGVTLALGPAPERRGLGGALHLAFEWPRSAEQGGTTLDLIGGHLRLGITLTQPLAPRTWLRAELGPGLEAVRFTARFSDSEITARDARIDWRPFGFGWLGLGARVAGVSCSAGPLLAVELYRTHYDVEQSGRRSEVLVPPLVQAGLVAGASW